MAKTPTVRELIDHVQEHYGLTQTEVLDLIRTPVHPKTLRDEMAMHVAPALFTIGVSTDYIASESYKLADSMLQQRLK